MKPEEQKIELPAIKGANYNSFSANVAARDEMYEHVNSSQIFREERGAKESTTGAAFLDVPYLNESMFPPANPLLPMKYCLHEGNYKPKYRLIFTPKQSLGIKMHGDYEKKRESSKTPMRQRGAHSMYQDCKRDASLRSIDSCYSSQDFGEGATKMNLFSNNNEIIAAFTKQPSPGREDSACSEDSEYEDIPAVPEKKGPKLQYCSKLLSDIILPVLFSDCKSCEITSNNTAVYSRGGKKYGIQWQFRDYTMDVGDLLSSKGTIFYTYEYLRAAERRDKLLENPLKLRGQGLVFDSKFECGNLQYALRLSENSYQLVLQNDSNSDGNTLWFYFKVLNARKNQLVTFNIMNISKNVWLYTKGMKVAVYSKTGALQKNEGWKREGERLDFFQNSYPNYTRENERFYSLRFSYCFRFDHDEVYFAYSVPYTYTQLTDYLHRLSLSKTGMKWVEKSLLCKTVSGLKCEYLVITDRKKTAETGATGESSLPVKKSIIFTARVHPGESVSSWMMKGILDFLTGESSYAELLRERFVFVIVPMLNPDGVVFGNYRCCAAGFDLNRKYLSPSKIFQPTIYYTKKLVRKISRVHPVSLYIDFHGHSGSQDIFAYGNTESDSPEIFRTYPFILSKINSNFSFETSKFGVQSSKLSTARICMWRELRIPFVYTIEASFFGKKNSRAHYTNDELEEIGKKSCEAILLLLDI